MQPDRFAVQREMDGALNTLLLPGIRMRLKLHRQIRSNCTLAHTGGIALPRREFGPRRSAQRIDGLVKSDSDHAEAKALGGRLLGSRKPRRPSSDGGASPID
jgi:hypothetical protein